MKICPILLVSIIFIEELAMANMWWSKRSSLTSSLASSVSTPVHRSSISGGNPVKRRKRSESSHMTIPFGHKNKSSRRKKNTTFIIFSRIVRTGTGNALKKSRYN